MKVMEKYSIRIEKSQILDLVIEARTKAEAVAIAHERYYDNAFDFESNCDDDMNYSCEGEASSVDIIQASEIGCCFNYEGPPREYNEEKLLEVTN